MQIDRAFGAVFIFNVDWIQ